VNRRAGLAGRRRGAPPSRRAIRGLLGALVGLGLVGSRSTPAHADGAFPDSFAPLLPRTRPHQILLATNFGLVSSDDDGASWAYACELPDSAYGRLYNLGAPPAERIYAVATAGLVASDDGGCRWTVGGGALAGAVVVDAFPDPQDDPHLLAIAAAAGARDLAVYESRDAGISFRGPLFAAPSGAVLTGVELAAGSPGTIYLSFYQTPGIHPRLARSSDGGASWRTADLEPALGTAVPFLAAVDPVAADTVYLRLSGRRSNEDAYEALAITRDAGASWATPLVLPGGTLTSFFRRADGTLLATGATAGAAVAHRSIDGGASFAPWRLAIHPRGFAERGGLLYAATDNLADGFALASSADGEAWTGLMRFQDITAVRACIQPVCQADCRFRAGLGLFAQAVCGGAPPADAGSPVRPSGGAVAASGCACQASEGEAAPIAWSLPALLALLALGRRLARV